MLVNSSCVMWISSYPLGSLHFNEKFNVCYSVSLSTRDHRTEPVRPWVGGWATLEAGWGRARAPCQSCKDRRADHTAPLVNTVYLVTWWPYLVTTVIPGAPTSPRPVSRVSDPSSHIRHAMDDKEYFRRQDKSFKHYAFFNMAIEKLGIIDSCFPNCSLWANFIIWTE